MSGNQFTARVQRPPAQWEGASDPVTEQSTPQVTPQVGQLLRAMSGEHARQELQTLLGLADREHFRKTYLLPALAAGLIEPTVPDKPNSRSQQYRLTAKGKGALN